MPITKIKISPEAVAIDYSVSYVDPDSNITKYNQYTVKSPEHPVLEFPKALQALDYHLIELCELESKPEDISIMCEDVEILGVTFKWKDGKFAASISGQKVLAYSSSPLILNSPMKREQNIDEKFDSMQHLNTTTVAALTKLIDHAENYVNGIRAQVEMFQQAIDTKISKVSVAMKGDKIEITDNVEPSLSEQEDKAAENFEPVNERISDDQIDGNDESEGLEVPETSNVEEPLD